MSSTQPAKADSKKVAAFKPRTTFDLKLGWPSIFPENRDKPFVFHMRIQLVKEAEELQREFLMLPDADQTKERFHEYDVEMMAQLSVAPPDGFPDFPEGIGSLPQAIREYFMPEDQERKEAMRFICRGTMSRYWREVVPTEYL